MLKSITTGQRSAILTAGILLLSILIVLFLSLNRAFAQQLSPSYSGPRIDTYIIQNGIDKSFIDLGDVVAGSTRTFRVKACAQNYQFGIFHRGNFQARGGQGSSTALGSIGSTRIEIEPFYVPIQTGATCFQATSQLITNSNDSGFYGYAIYGCTLNWLGYLTGNVYPCAQNNNNPNPYNLPPVYNPFQATLRFRLVIPPTLTFSAGPTSVTSGNSFSLNWSSTNTTSIDTSRSPASCPDAGALTPVVSGSKTLAAQTVTVASTCSYTATATGAGGSVSRTATVTVNPPATLTGINPNQGTVGTSVNVTLTGTNFAAGATINAGTDITASNTTVVSATQITATFVIAAGAPLGPRNITVTSDGVTTGPVTFTVIPVGSGSGPTISSITPNSGSQGCVVNVTLSGTNFASGATITAGTGITISNINVVSATQITATFTIASTATTGSHDVKITIGSLTSNPVTFTVTTNGCGSGGGGGSLPTSCGLLVCFSYDPKVIILPPPGFTRIIKPFIAEVAP